MFRPTYTEIAEIISESTGQTIDYRVAKRLMTNLGCDVAQITSEEKYERLLGLLTHPQGMWAYVDSFPYGTENTVQTAFKPTSPVENERIKWLGFQNAELRKALSALNNVIGEPSCK